MRYLDLNEFCSLVGRNKSSVSRAVAAGRITSIKRSGANRVFFHPEHAVEQFLGNTREALGLEPTPQQETKRERAIEELKVREFTPVEEPDIEDRDESTRRAAKKVNYNDSRAVSETYRARLLKLEFEERNKTLVDATKVTSAAAEAYRIVRNRLLAIPARLASDITHMTPHEAEQSMLNEISKALEEVESWQPIQ